MLLIEEKQLHSGIITVCCTEGAVGDYGIIRNSHSRNWYCSWEILYNGWSSHSAFFCQNGPVRAAGWHPPEMLHSWRKSVGQNDDQKITSFCMFLLLLCTLRSFLVVCNPTFLSDIPPKNIPHISIVTRPEACEAPAPWYGRATSADLGQFFPRCLAPHGGAMAGMMDPNMDPVGKSSPKNGNGPGLKGFCPWFWTNAEIYIYRNIYD